MTENGSSWPGKLQKMGYLVIFAFVVYSVFHVTFITKSEVFDPDVKTITVAHWFCTEDVRQGYEAVFKRFEEMKAGQGVKVQVKQSTVPAPGYGQWSVTQLIGGNPADIMAIDYRLPQMYINRYFVALTPFVSQKNSFNAGTILEDFSWQDSLVDNMVSYRNFDDIYQVNSHLFLFRFFVNLDLLEKATGSKNLPRDVVEWMNDCEKIKKYADETGKPIVPILYRGRDNFTLNMLATYYFTQLNGGLYEFDIDGNLASGEILRFSSQFTDGDKRVFSLIELLHEIGQYFGDGFSTMDNEQCLYFFFSGNAGFHFSGSYDITAMLEETDFNVGIMALPPIGYEHSLGKYFSGPVSESGIPGDQGFGITKATKHFDLALELLQYITSYEMNQLISSYCNYLPIVRNARYEGPLEHFKPQLEGQPQIQIRMIPYSYNVSQPAYLKWVKNLENVIKGDGDNAVEYFRKGLHENNGLLLAELDESLSDYRRKNFDREKNRSLLSVGMLRTNLDGNELEILRNRERFASQAYTGLSLIELLNLLDYREQIKKR